MEVTHAQGALQYKETVSLSLQLNSMVEGLPFVCVGVSVCSF